MIATVSLNANGARLCAWNALIVWIIGTSACDEYLTFFILHSSMIKYRPDMCVQGICYFNDNTKYIYTWCIYCRWILNVSRSGKSFNRSMYIFVFVDIPIVFLMECFKSRLTFWRKQRRMRVYHTCTTSRRMTYKQRHAKRFYCCNTSVDQSYIVSRIIVRAYDTPPVGASRQWRCNRNKNSPPYSSGTKLYRIAVHLGIIDNFNIDEVDRTTRRRKKTPKWKKNTPAFVREA